MKPFEEKVQEQLSAALVIVVIVMAAAAFFSILQEYILRIYGENVCCWKNIRFIVRDAVERGR